MAKSPNLNNFFYCYPFTNASTTTGICDVKSQFFFSLTSFSGSRNHWTAVSEERENNQKMPGAQAASEGPQKCCGLSTQ